MECNAMFGVIGAFFLMDLLYTSYVGKIEKQRNKLRNIDCFHIFIFFFTACVP